MIVNYVKTKIIIFFNIRVYQTIHAFDCSIILRRSPKIMPNLIVILQIISNSKWPTNYKGNLLEDDNDL